MFGEKLEQLEPNSVEDAIRRIVAIRKHFKSSKTRTSKVPPALNSRYGTNPHNDNQPRRYEYPQDPLRNPHLTPIEQIMKANEKITKMGLKLDPNNNIPREFRIDDEVGKPRKETSNCKIQDLNLKLRNSTQQVINQNKQIKELKSRLDEQGITIENLKSRLSRSENLSHHKQLLLEQYKSKLTDIQSKASILDKKLLREKASTRCNNLHDMKIVEDNMIALKRKEKDLQEQCAKLEDDKLNLEEELPRKNIYIKKQLQLQQTKAQEVNDRLKMYDQAVEEFLWMVEDLVYEHNTQPDPVRKAHQMACSVLNLTPGELREMFRDCNASYETEPPRLFDKWLNEYRTIASRDSDDFPQIFAQFLFKICFTEETGPIVTKRKELHKL